jgi:hypothetical protein
MAAGVYDLVIEQGATLNTTFTWKDPSGTAINITSYTARAMFRPDYGSDPVLSLTTADSTIAITGASGIVTFNVPAATTAFLYAGTGVWDLELVAPNGTVTRLIGGSYTVSTEVTR